MPAGKLWFRREGAVLESRAEGQLHESSAALLTRELELAHAEHGWCGALHDWTGVTGYRTKTRIDWVRWATTPAGRAVRFVHFRLGPDKLVRMAVAVASMAFSGVVFTTHESAATFEAVRAEHVSSRHEGDGSVEDRKSA